MKFSAKSEYGVIAVLALAMAPEGIPLQVRTIAEEQDIPQRFLEQIMSSLKKSGIVESIRGSQGGYTLAKRPADIFVNHIIEAIDGPILPRGCVSEGLTRNCVKADICVVKEIWEEVKMSILNVLGSISIEDMCKKKLAKKNSRLLTT